MRLPADWGCRQFLWRFQTSERRRWLTEHYAFLGRTTVYSAATAFGLPVFHDRSDSIRARAAGGVDSPVVLPNRLGRLAVSVRLLHAVRLSDGAGSTGAVRLLAAWHGGLCCKSRVAALPGLPDRGGRDVADDVRVAPAELYSDNADAAQSAGVDH